MEQSSYLNFLPGTYRDPNADTFLAGFLAAWERVLSLPPDREPDQDVSRHSIGAVIQALPEFIYPRLSFLFPPDDERFIPPLRPEDPAQQPWPSLTSLGRYLNTSDASQTAAWLHQWLAFCASTADFSLPAEWTLDHQRSAIAEVLPTYRIRGTVPGLTAWLRITLPLPDEEIPPTSTSTSPSPTTAASSLTAAMTPSDIEALALVASGAAEDEHLQAFYEPRIRRLGAQLYGDIDTTTEALVARIRRDLIDSESASNDPQQRLDHTSSSTPPSDQDPPPLPTLIPEPPSSPDAPAPNIDVIDLATAQRPLFQLDRDRLDDHHANAPVLDGYAANLLQSVLVFDQVDLTQIHQFKQYATTLINQELPIGVESDLRVRTPTMVIGQLTIGRTSILGDRELQMSST